MIDPPVLRQSREPWAGCLSAAVVILGNGIWKNRYGSDPGVIGRSVKVNELPSTVIGCR